MKPGEQTGPVLSGFAMPLLADVPLAEEPIPHLNSVLVTDSHGSAVLNPHRQLQRQQVGQRRKPIASSHICRDLLVD